MSNVSGGKDRALKPWETLAVIAGIGVLSYGAIRFFDDSDARKDAALNVASNSITTVEATPETTPEPTPEPERVEIGEIGTLVGAPLEKGGVSKIVVLGRTQDDYEAFIKANGASDDVGIRELMMQNRIFTVSPGQIKARKLDASWTGLIEVRILSGAHKDEAAWTASECLQKP